MKFLITLWIILLIILCSFIPVRADEELGKLINELGITSAKWGFMLGYSKALEDIFNYRLLNIPFLTQEEREEYFKKEYKKVKEKNEKPNPVFEHLDNLVGE